MIKKLILLLLCAWGTTHAHNPKIATYNLRDTGIGWYLEMSFARSTLDKQMIQLHGEDLVKNSTKAEYQKLIVNYLMDHIFIEADGTDLAFGQGGIRLGDHQTDLKYIIKSLSDPQHLNVKINTFEEERNHTNLFRIYKGDVQIGKYFLSEENQFSTQFMIENDKIISINQASLNRSTPFSTKIILVIGLIPILAGLLFMVNKLKK
ncbi:hypothetical protein MY04_0093 [Flammeovirga sp. MY04]|uniref:hypothetical protein n=1 Tax=Flammeovirga sp. MY04 TaxID=1191459 RepID=UPI0008061392|nr:hypothetical protein [Flammeovirga sp. MY04]ANQ47476.1 hypothetical protein MY04_0093 [Flammeovirga sp. MY04]